MVTALLGGRARLTSGICRRRLLTCSAWGLAAFAFVVPIAFTTISGAAVLDPVSTTTVTTQPAVPTSAPVGGGVVVLDHGPSDTIVAGGSLLAQSLDAHTIGSQAIAGISLPRTGGSPVPLTLTALIFLVAGVLAIRTNRRAPLR